MSWNFALILFVLLIVTGIVWSLDRFSLRHKRATRVMQALELARPSWAGLPDHEKLKRQEQIQVEFAEEIKSQPDVHLRKYLDPSSLSLAF